MKTNLKFKLIKFKRAIVFQILKQTEEWRKKENCDNIYKFNYKKIIIASEESAELFFEYDEKEKNLFVGLKGYSKTPAEIDLSDFDNNKQRDKYFNLIIEALKEWSKHVYKITNREPQEPKELGNDTYEY